MELSVWATGLVEKAAWLLLVILLDVVMGVASAVKAKKFQWQCLANFLGHYGPQVVTWVCLEALSLLPVDLQSLAGLAGALGPGAYLIIFVAAIGSVLNSAKEIGVMPTIPGVKDNANPAS